MVVVLCEERSLVDGWDEICVIVQVFLRHSFMLG